MTLHYYSLRIVDPNGLNLLSIKLPLSEAVLSRRTDFALENNYRLELVPHVGQPYPRYRMVFPVTPVSGSYPEAMPDACQPIGCDNGYHLPGCSYDNVDKP